MSVAWVVPLVVLQRALELVLCRRNRLSMMSRGGEEFHPRSYPVMAALHASFLASLAWEAYPWRVPLDALTVICLAALAAVTVLRYVGIATLGERWTTRIVVVPGDRIVRTGPYRFLRHPNYLVIVLEFILLPLLLRAPFTLVMFSLANLLVLRQRIRLEEGVLRELTDF